jgi:hypothetical protein
MSKCEVCGQPSCELNDKYCIDCFADIIAGLEYEMQSNK